MQNQDRQAENVDAICRIAARISDAVARSRYLEQTCVGDAELRVRVEKRLAELSSRANPPDSDTAPTILANGDTGQLNSPSSIVLRETSQRLFGDYELLAEIARGGMGVVYKARQLSLNRTVALKMILAGQLASEAEVKRFHMEAQAAASLRHTNIVGIHEIGQQDGRHFFSMDYVDGPHLGHLVKHGPLPADRAARLIKTIAEAIQFAHQRGVLHRDLKPQNVLLGTEDVPVVTDFGLAKWLERESSLTQSGAIMGSPSYMPPEQAEGRLDRVGPASDVYSLGAILYELITGRPPFAGLTGIEIIRKVIDSEPPKPTRLNGGLPADLETICLKCLDKDPVRRYASARELAEDLGRFLQREPILATPAPMLRRALSWGRKNPWTITAGAAFLLLFLVSGAYGLWETGQYWKWQFLHPQLPKPMKWFYLSSATGAIALVVTLALIGWIPLLELSRRRLRREAVPAEMVKFFWVMTAAQLAGALFITLGWMEAMVWNAVFKLKYPLTGMLPAFTLAWFGLVLGWRLRRQDGSPTVGAAAEIETRKLRYGGGLLAFVASLAGNALYAHFLIIDQRFWNQRYWLLTFLFASASVLVMAYSVVLFLATRTESRVFWLFTLLVTAAVVMELHAKLPMGQKWQSACLGLLEGVVLAKVLWPGLFKQMSQDAWRITRSSVLNRSRRDQPKD